jgi:hypothetical protein
MMRPSFFRFALVLCNNLQDDHTFRQAHKRCACRSVRLTVQARVTPHYRADMANTPCQSARVNLRGLSSQSRYQIAIQGMPSPGRIAALDIEAALLQAQSARYSLSATGAVYYSRNCVRCASFLTRTCPLTNNCFVTHGSGGEPGKGHPTCRVAWWD